MSAVLSQVASRTYIEHYWEAAAIHEVDIVNGCAEFIGTRSGIFGANFGRPIGQLRSGNFIPANSLFSRRLWKEVGGFDPKVGLIDDWDFWLSCVEAGAKAHFIAEPLWQYRRHPASKLSSTNQALEAERQRSVDLVTSKHSRFINGQLGWRRAMRSLDRKTARIRRSARRRVRRLISSLRSRSA